MVDGTLCLQTRVSAFPIGIDPERFMHALENEEVRMHIEELKRRFAGRKVMLGVDRLDMIKGIPQKLLAVEKCLEEHPEVSLRRQLHVMDAGLPQGTSAS